MIIRNELKPRFVGERFERQTLPLEFAADLKALQDLIQIIAKWHFINDHKGTRKRGPRHLSSLMEMHIVGIDPGSAIPVLGVFADQPELDFDNLFSRSVTTFLSVVENIGKNESWELPLGFPQDAIKLFEPFGKSLYDSERIEFAVTSDVPIIKYDVKVRNKILAKVAPDRLERRTLRGKIVEIDLDANTFQLRTYDSKVTGRISDGFHRKLIDVFSSERRLVIDIEGICIHNSKDRALRLEKLDRMDIVNTEVMRDRLDQISSLRPTWLMGLGRDRDGLLRDFWDAWESFVLHNLPQPNLFPIDDDGIEVEWTAGDEHVSLELALTDLKGRLIYFNDNTSELRESPVNLTFEEAWEDINKAAGEIMLRFHS